MRYVKNLFDIVESGQFVGSNRAHGRVTIDPYWELGKTNPAYRNSIRGPYRWYQWVDNDGYGSTSREYEIPNIKSISIDRSSSNDIATCNISMYNQWHQRNNEESELSGQLGSPGYFWFDRGRTVESSARWNHSESFGAYDYNGVWHEDFSWRNVLVPHGLLRTYQGYGGFDVYGNPLPISEAVDNENILITGVWLIDTIVSGDDGLINISCRDIGRLLLDQFIYPPIVPDGLYPVEYYPPGKSAFDSPWAPKPKLTTGNEATSRPAVNFASRGPVKLDYAGSSLDCINDQTNYSYNIPLKISSKPTPNGTTIYTGRGSHAIDGNDKTYALSEAYKEPDSDSATTWFDFWVGGVNAQEIDSISLKPWAGAYDCYISICSIEERPGSPGMVDYVWQGTETIPWTPNPDERQYKRNTPPSSPLYSKPNIKYVKRVGIPAGIPDGNEKYFTIQLPQKYTANLIRITFRNLYFSSLEDENNLHYRSGIRDLLAYRTGDPTGSYNAPFNSQKWTFAIAAHPTRGYWVGDDDGNVYGFGDAKNYSAKVGGAFSPIDLRKNEIADNALIAVCAHPDGMGFWALDRKGRVSARGSAQLYQDSFSRSYVEVPTPPPVPPFGVVFGFSVQAIDMAITHTGEGYWVIYNDGTVRGFGDANPSYTVVPNTAVGRFMTAAFYNDGDLHPGNPFYINGAGWNTKIATGIASHPKKMGCWITNGHGEVFAYGPDNFADLHSYGGLVERTYNKGTTQEFHLGNREWTKNIESTDTGNGYWIAFGGGKIAAFGDAVEKNGTADVYASARSRYSIDLPEGQITDFSFFRCLIWDLTRDPDGKGFWVLAADGSVGSFEAESWGQPAYWDRSGFDWHEGNYEDYSDIVKEFLMWSGFLLYDENNLLGIDSPTVYGNIESTGVKTDTVLPADQFDKKTIVDAIKQLAEVVAYLFYIQEDGSVRFESPNWWSPGNFDQNGQRIYVDESGNRLTQQEVEDYPQPTFPSEVTITAPYTMNSGDSISCNGATLTMQADGNLVLMADTPDVGRWSPNRGRVWSSGTFGSDIHAEFKTDGNFAVVSTSNGIIWESNTDGNPGATLTLSYDQNLFIYDSDASPSRIWSTNTGIDTKVTPSSFIPVVDEEVDLMNYNVTLNWDQMRSEIIIGTERPDPNNPSATGYTRYVPPMSTEEIKPNVPALRGIERPAVWTNSNFTNKEEVKLMTELIALHSFFSQRSGSITCPANPCITINDQVRIYERVTSDTYVHYIQSINTSMDLDTGVYTASMNVHWLGDENSDWVIQASDDGSASYLDRFIVSERVDRWQRATGRGLQSGGTSTPNLSSIVQFNGGFDTLIIEGS